MTRLLTSVPDDRPTSAELTAGDVDLFRSDQAKPPHFRATCTTPGCWACAWETRPARMCAVPPVPPTGGAA